MVLIILKKLTKIAQFRFEVQLPHSGCEQNILKLQKRKGKCEENQLENSLGQLTYLIYLANRISKLSSDDDISIPIISTISSRRPIEPWRHNTTAGHQGRTTGITRYHNRVGQPIVGVVMLGYYIVIQDIDGKVHDIVGFGDVKSNCEPITRKIT